MARQDTAIKLLQAVLEAELGKREITPPLIAEKLDWLLQAAPQFGIDPDEVDRQATIDEMVRRFSLWIGRDTMLTSDTGHEAWLVSSRKNEWRYWPRYREWLDARLSARVIDAMDRSTDAVLELLEDPLRPGGWDRRGLVVGNIQSGKTGHYIGLVCKAADAGYKIVIVLAGLHNNLRSQTQMRLDEGFLGYETRPREEDIEAVGVGKIDGDPAIRPNFATNRTNNGDFTTRVARNLGISPEQRPWLFVVKKNKTVLDRLLRWIRNHVADLHDPSRDRRVVTRLPLLMIDDEADHASVDTGEQIVDEDGNPDENHQPTTINRLVRRILHSFVQSAYVGYTATPFANIFIHERGTTTHEGPDLFPAAFIVNLAAPSDYIGSARIFGTEGERSGSLDLVRTVDDHSLNDDGGWMPARHKNGHVPLYRGEDRLPPSLAEAVDAFVLASAARRARGQATAHSSMLIHVTRFTSVQAHVHRQVEERVRRLRQRLTRGIGSDEVIGGLRSLWERDFKKVMRRANIDEAAPRGSGNAWHEVLARVPDVVSDIAVKTINGTAKDALDYPEHGKTGLTAIAIGGDKLSRGLTLEGLCVSYFLRASRMYDTLMQMGRWFGYRPGYLDLCRLYTTPDLAEWFRHITDAADELREEFDQMAARGGTPRDYGLKVQSHPVLMVTSRLKMRTARNLMLSFSGTLVETVALYRSRNELEKNLAVTRELISVLGDPREIDPERRRDGRRFRWKGFLWKDVPASHILEFLAEYRTHPAAHKVNGVLLSEFIQKMLPYGELTRWTVALIGGGEGAEIDLRHDIRVKTLQRRPKGSPHENRYSIGRLVSPRDETIDLGDAEWDAALTMSRDQAGREGKELPKAPSPLHVRRVRGFGGPGVPGRPDSGLLLIYVLDPLKAGIGTPDEAPRVAAFAISFPGSNRGEKVEYKVNNVLWEQWEQEYGSAE